MSDDQGPVRTEFAFDVVDNDVANVKGTFQEIENTARATTQAIGGFAEEIMALPFDAMSEQARTAFYEIEESIDRVANKQEGLSRGMGGIGAVGGLSRLGGTVGRLTGSSEITQVSQLGQALPQLASGAKDAFSGVQSVIGGLGKLAIVGGIAGIAIVALGVVLTAAFKNAREEAAEFAANIDAIRVINEKIASGLTTTIAQTELDRLIKARELETEINELAAETAEKYNEAAKDSIATQAASALAAATGIVAWRDLGSAVDDLDPRVKGANDALSESDAILADYDEQIQQLTQSMQDGSLTANDIAEAEEKLAGVREEQATEAARNAERASAAQAKAVEDTAAAYEKGAKRIADAQSQYSSAVASANAATAAAISEAKNTAKRALADLAKETQQAYLDSLRDYHQAQLEVNEDYYQDEQQARRDHERTIRDIYRDAGRDQEDLLAKRDFLAMDELSRQTRRALEDVATGAIDEKKERDIAAAIRLEDLKASLQLEQEEIQLASEEKQEQLKEDLKLELRQIEEAGAKRLRELRASYQEEVMAAQEAMHQKLSDIQKALQEELDMTQDGTSKKLQLEAAYWEQSINQVRQATAAVSGPVSTNTNQTWNTQLQVNGSGLTSSELYATMANLLVETGIAQ